MGQQFDDAVSMRELCRAIKECRRGVGHKDGPVDWYAHRLIKAQGLRDEILSGRYKMRKGSVVKVYRPKYREAVAPWFRDRVWQRSMCNNGVYDDLTHGFLYDNMACQVGKGTDLAIRRTIKMLQRIYRTTGSNDGWGDHMDVKRYFPSTPHQEIKDLDQRRISEPMFLPYLEELIESVEDPRTEEEILLDPFGARGTGLGSQINQLHQVALLDSMDHEIKCFCKCYQRYNDDVLVLDKDKQICVRAKEIVTLRLQEKGLTCVDKSGIFRLRDGFWYLRHKFILTDTGKVILLLHPSVFKTERHALQGMKRKLDRGEITMENVRVHYQAFIANASYSSGKGAIRAMDKFYTQTFREKPEYKLKRRYLYGKPNQKRKPPAPGGAAEKPGADSADGTVQGNGVVPGRPV